MSILIVAAIIIPVLFVFALIEKTVCYALPFLNIIKWIIVIAVGIYFSRLIGINEPTGYGPVNEQTTFDMAGAIFCFIIYGLAIVVFKLLTSPLSMFFEMLNSTKEKSKEEVSEA